MAESRRQRKTCLLRQQMRGWPPHQALLIQQHIPNLYTHARVENTVGLPAGEVCN